MKAAPAPLQDPPFVLRLAQSAGDIAAAQRLRYEVFVKELGGGGPEVDHARRLEKDAFDPLCDHLLLSDPVAGPQETGGVIGVYRLLPGERLKAGAGFYSESEFDLAPLRASGRRLLELGRSCVHQSYRGGAAMPMLWNGLASYITQREIEVLFGVASFQGTDVAAWAGPLRYLHDHHLAPEGLRAQAKGAAAYDLAGLPPGGMSRAAALEALPPLIRAYLRLGGFVGQGAWVDRAFNTIDVLLVIDVARLPPRHQQFYARQAERPLG